MFWGTMPLDHLQISLEVRHGYFGAAAFAFLVIYGLVILFLSRTQYRTPFFAEFCCHFSEGTGRELQLIKSNSPARGCLWQDFSEVANTTITSLFYNL